MNLNNDLAERRYGKSLMPLIDIYRSISLAVDQNPNHIVEALNNNPIIVELFKKSLRLESQSHLNRVLAAEGLSYGDAGASLSTPGLSLSGTLLYELGNQSQKDYFVGEVEKRFCRTFCAVTEPDKGSDASNMESRLYNGKLSAKKLLVGNAAAGEIGTILFRTSNDALDIRAAYLTPAQLHSNFIQRSNLDQYALRGSQIGSIFVEDLPLPEDQLLGNHLSPMARGMMSLIKVFIKYRTLVSATAIGTSQAIVDYALGVSESSVKTKSLIKELNFKIDVCRKMNLHAASQTDKNPMDTVPASLAKIHSCSIAKKTAITISNVLPLELGVLNPWLSKLTRDCFAFEWMEGTSNIHRQNVISGLKRNYFDFVRQA